MNNLVSKLQGLVCEEWSNDACLGYMIKACRDLGYNQVQIKQLVDELVYVFDIKTVSEAKEIYNNFHC